MPPQPLALGSQFTKLLHRTSETDPWVQVEGTVSVSESGGGSTNIDATHQNSVSKEYLAGLAEAGTVTVPMNTLEAARGPKQLELYVSYTGKADHSFFRIAIPTTRAATEYIVKDFTGFVSAWDDDYPLDGKVGTNMTIQKSGPTVRTEGVTDILAATLPTQQEP